MSTIEDPNPVEAAIAATRIEVANLHADLVRYDLEGTVVPGTPGQNEDDRR